DPSTFVINTAALTSDIVEVWMSGFKAKDGTSVPSKSVHGTAMSALSAFYQQHGTLLPDVMRASVKQFTKGVARTRAELKQTGEIPLEEGKAHVPGDLYLTIVRALLTNGDVFCHVFCVLAWNLMVRVSNVASLCAANFSFSEDSLQVAYVKHKADQEGERTDPKHCYANPLNPAACVITALGIHFACFGAPKRRTDVLFEGQRQHDRFVRKLRKVLNEDKELKGLIDRQGITVDDIASHSLRKGGRSYCAGGSTMGPSTATVLLRGGWRQDGMDQKYVRYEHAGDQLVGRYLSMLDVSSPTFATLPPHFEAVDDDVLNAVRLVFPDAAEGFEGVLVTCLASLVYHRAYFRETLAPAHKLFKTTLFTQGLADKLGPRVALSFPGDVMRSTGVPPITQILGDLQDLKQTVATFPTLVGNTLHEELEKRQFDAGQLTREVVETLVKDMQTKVVAEIGSLRNGLHAAVAGAPAAPNAGQQANDQFQRWMWGGQMHPVPEEFDLDTSLPPATLFQLYLLGDEQERIGPYKMLTSQDVVGKQAKARVSDMHKLMEPIIDSLKKQHHWHHQPTVHEVNTMWERGKTVIRGNERSNKGKKRRLKEMAWTTALKEYRKRGRESNDQDDDNDLHSSADQHGAESVDAVGVARRPPKGKGELYEK
ncbi:MAG TPA: hypothetical protein VLA04_01845, partial [Verrucomicrobiae bacterium]|nr:hypothetical protein [Verrucomicrobiae bacterium]